jgi:antitoxin HigA-1
MERKNRLPPVHPGEIIREDVLPEVGLSVTDAAKALGLGVSRQMLHDILAERKPLSAVMCLKISRLLGSSPEFWMRLQADYDLKKATQNKDVMERVGRIVPVKPREEVHA